jgi:catechol 2,3-dioxygenase-like lactoylglutathione lyase family enzyme
VAAVRYLVDDVGAAVEFYVDKLGFAVREDWGPVVIVERGDLQLWLSGPKSSAGRHSVQGNRFVVQVADLDQALDGMGPRPEVVDGAAGRWAVVTDPAGNPVELFETA